MIEKSQKRDFVQLNNNVEAKVQLKEVNVHIQGQRDYQLQMKIKAHKMSLQATDSKRKDKPSNEKLSSSHLKIAQSKLHKSKFGHI